MFPSRGGAGSTRGCAAGQGAEAVGSGTGLLLTRQCLGSSRLWGTDGQEFQAGALQAAGEHQPGAGRRVYCPAPQSNRDSAGPELDEPGGFGVTLVTR